MMNKIVIDYKTGKCEAPILSFHTTDDVKCDIHIQLLNDNEPIDLSEVSFKCKTQLPSGVENEEIVSIESLSDAIICINLSKESLSEEGICFFQLVSEFNNQSQTSHMWNYNVIGSLFSDDSTEEEDKDSVLEKIQELEKQLLNVYTKENVNDLLTGFSNRLPDKYYNETEVDNLLNDKASVDHTHNFNASIDVKELNIKWEDVNNKPLVFTPAKHTHDNYVTTENAVSRDDLNSLIKSVESKISNKASISDLDNKADIGHTHTNYANINDVYTKNDVYSKTEVERLIADITIEGSDDTDLSLFVTKSELTSELSTKANKVHTHDDYASINHNHSNYAIKTDTYTKSEVDDLISSIDVEIPETDLSDYVTNSVLNERLNTKADKVHTHDNYASIDHSHSNYAIKNDTYTKTEVDGLLSSIDIPETDLSDYVTNSVLNESLNTKANRVHTHSEYANVEHTHNNYAIKNDTYTKSEVEGLIEAIPEPDLSDYVTNSQLTIGLNTKANSIHTHDQYATIVDMTAELVKKSDILHKHKSNEVNYIDGRSVEEVLTYILTELENLKTPVLPENVLLTSDNEVIITNDEHPILFR